MLNKIYTLIYHNLTKFIDYYTQRLTVLIGFGLGLSLGLLLCLAASNIKIGTINIDHILQEHSNYLANQGDVHAQDLQYIKHDVQQILQQKFNQIMLIEHNKILTNIKIKDYTKELQQELIRHYYSS